MAKKAEKQTNNQASTELPAVSDVVSDVKGAGMEKATSLVNLVSELTGGIRVVIIEEEPIEDAEPSR